tara:strand:+ start:1310 stop:1630 length:321 start_codon:yes stop_codon:yes gene_type:complete
MSIITPKKGHCSNIDGPEMRKINLETGATNASYRLLALKNIKKNKIKALENQLALEKKFMNIKVRRCSKTGDYIGKLIKIAQRNSMIGRYNEKKVVFSSENNSLVA